jgi:hypothetical protein
VKSIANYLWIMVAIEILLKSNNAELIFSRSLSDLKKNFAFECVCLVLKCLSLKSLWNQNSQEKTSKTNQHFPFTRFKSHLPLSAVLIK